jgi:hypothetical protein
LFAWTGKTPTLWTVDEKRRTPRVEWQGEATVKLLGHRDGVSCRILDVAVGGMKLLGPLDAPKGKVVHIDFRLGDTSAWLEAEGVIVRELDRHGYPVWGVKFHNLDPGTRTRLEDFVRSHSQAASGT